jgi:hydroxymethylpyrimidine pyrophosphatase-like HAD family hydrolase
MVALLQEKFADMKIKFSIGGQISFDAFPEGWDKTFCLQFLAHENFDQIHFFGDKTYPVRFFFCCGESHQCSRFNFGCAILLV